MLSTILPAVDAANTMPYTKFLTSFGTKICNEFIHQTHGEIIDSCAAQMKLDFVECYANVFKHIHPDEIGAIIQSQFKIEDIVAGLLRMLEESTAMKCIEILGILICHSETICTKLVSSADFHFIHTL